MWTNWVINSIGAVQTEPDGTRTVRAILEDSSGKVLGDFEIQQQGSNVVAIRLPQKDMYILDVDDIRTLDNGSPISVGPAVPQSDNQ